MIPLIQIKYVTLISILDALNPMTESSSKTPENPILEVLDNEAKQALRLQRFSMAFATYVACGLLAQACAWLGHLPPLLPAWWAIGVAVPNVVFFVMLRSGWNLRLRDPSMTEMQLVVSMFAVMVLIYHADAARSTFLMLFPVPLLFGVLRLRMYQMARVGAVGIVGYAGVIAMIAVNRPARVQLDVELLNLLALSGAMGFVCIMGGYISKVRAQLSHSLDTIRELAQRDPLTNLFNRRFLMETLTREILRRERGQAAGWCYALSIWTISNWSMIRSAIQLAMKCSLRSEDVLLNRFAPPTILPVMAVKNLPYYLRKIRTSRRLLCVSAFVRTSLNCRFQHFKDSNSSYRLALRTGKAETTRLR